MVLNSMEVRGPHTEHSYQKAAETGSAEQDPSRRTPELRYGVFNMDESA